MKADLDQMRTLPAKQEVLVHQLSDEVKRLEAELSAAKDRLAVETSKLQELSSSIATQEEKLHACGS